MWSNEQIERWRLTYQTYVNESFSVKECAEVDQRRTLARQEMTQVLKTFLDGDASLNAFNTLFQQKTHHNWSAFHLQGMSGGLFLNRLVKHVPSEDTFGHLFRLVLRVPEDKRDGRCNIQAFLQFLEGLITSRQVTRAQLQPARVLFFLGVCWHVQDPERWPIFYLDVRHAILSEVAPAPLWQDPVAMYFAFRALPRARRGARPRRVATRKPRLMAYEEACTNKRRRERANVFYQQKRGPSYTDTQASVCTHQAGRGQERERFLRLARRGAPGSLSDAPAVAAREAGAQGGLSRLDRRERTQQRVAARAFGQSQPSDHSRPGRYASATGNSTDRCAVATRVRCRRGLRNRTNAHRRLHDLGTLLPTRQAHLCIVTPGSRFEKIRFELSGPSFRDQGPRKNCVLISEELLLQQETHILRWASSPAVIEELICHTGDGER